MSSSKLDADLHVIIGILTLLLSTMMVSTNRGGVGARPKRRIISCPTILNIHGFSEVSSLIASVNSSNRIRRSVVGRKMSLALSILHCVSISNKLHAGSSRGSL